MLASMRMGTMGYSICAAMASNAAKPDSQIVAVVGDEMLRDAVVVLPCGVEQRRFEILIVKLG